MANIKVCPKTEQDIKTASNKLKCKYDRYNNSQYMCIPNKEKTSLVEFCHNGEMGIVEEGNCLEASLGTVSLHNCSRFERGCPNTTFFKYEMHKHSVCQEINTDQNCYVADPFCLPQKEEDVFNTYVVVIIVLAIIGFGLICYFWREIISAIYRCARKHIVKPGTEQEEEIPLVDRSVSTNEVVFQLDHVKVQASDYHPQREQTDEHFTPPKPLATTEHNESVNQGRTENIAVPPANPIKEQASNFQSQSEYIERDGSPGQIGLCIRIKDDAKIDAIHYDNCDSVDMNLNMQGNSTIGKIIIKKDKDRKNSGPSSDRAEGIDQENSGRSSDRTESIDREKSGSSSDRTEDQESPGRSSDRTDDRENSGPSSDRTEGIDREKSGSSSDRTEDLESPGRSSDRTDDQENSGSSSDRTEDRENSGPIYDRLEDLGTEFDYFGFKPEPNNKSEDEQQLKDPSLAGKEVSDKELD